MHPPEELNIDGKIGGLEVLPDGRLIMHYTESGPAHLSRTDDHPELPVLARTSDDAGRTWSAPRRALTIPAGKGQGGVGLSLIDLSGALHLFGNRIIELPVEGKGDYHSRLLHTVSRDGGATWSPLQRIDFGHDYTGALNCVIATDSGRILLPISYLAKQRQTGRFVSLVVYSDDGGETWQTSNDIVVDSGGTYIESGAIEPVIVQFPSGMVWMLVRTQTGYLWESFSNDGAWWTPPKPTRIVSGNGPAGLVRLRDGRIALFWNNLYGEPFREPGNSYLRHTLHGAISSDEAQTWSAPKVVATKRPEDDWRTFICYPVPIEGPDGAILMRYGRAMSSRTPGPRWPPTVHLVRIDPDWLAAG